jgi:SAM-dependent methyltransferase
LAASAGIRFSRKARRTNFPAAAVVNVGPAPLNWGYKGAMSLAANTFTAETYTPRADAYVASAVHASGPDLDQIEAAVRGLRDARVLDLGCGGGHVSYRAAPHVSGVVAVDLTPAMLEAVSRTAAERGFKNISTVLSAAEGLPFEDGAFDIVLCRFTTHHWADMEAGLREARRVLKPHCRAVFVDVVAPRDTVLDTHLQAVEVLRDASHVRDYSVAEWLAALSRVGFAVGSVTMRKLRMDFATWIARTATPDSHAAAIRSLQATASSVVRGHFAVDEDGGFDLDVATFEVTAQ